MVSPHLALISATALSNSAPVAQPPAFTVLSGKTALVSSLVLMSVFSDTTVVELSMIVGACMFGIGTFSHNRLFALNQSQTSITHSVLTLSVLRKTFCLGSEVKGPQRTFAMFFPLVNLPTSPETAVLCDGSTS